MKLLQRPKLVFQFYSQSLIPSKQHFHEKMKQTIDQVLVVKLKVFNGELLKNFYTQNVFVKSVGHVDLVTPVYNVCNYKRKQQRWFLDCVGFDDF